MYGIWMHVIHVNFSFLYKLGSKVGVHIIHEYILKMIVY